MSVPAAVIAEFGEVGSQIRGSRFVRSYCPSCHEPMRVSKEVIGHHGCCEDCDEVTIATRGESRPLSRRREMDGICDDGRSTHVRQAMNRIYREGIVES